MATKYADQGVSFLFIYTRESHPGENLPALTSLDQKLDHARRFAARWNVKRPLYVDDLEGTLHKAYGCLPNMTWIVNRRGRVVYKANWTDARSIEAAVEQLLWERDAKQTAERMTPYQVEWQVNRVAERPPFMRGLHNAGPAAIQQFIDAIRVSAGEGPARQLEKWWAANRDLLDGE